MTKTKVNNLYKHILENSMSGILVIDFFTKKIIFANKKISKISGFLKKDFLDKNCNEINFFKSSSYCQKIINAIESKKTTAYDRVIFKTANDYVLYAKILIDSYGYDNVNFVRISIIDETQYVINEIKLKHKLNFERVIGETAKILSRASINDVIKKINSSLIKIGKFIGAEHAAIFMFLGEKKGMKKVFDWKDKRINFDGIEVFDTDDYMLLNLCENTSSFDPIYIRNMKKIAINPDEKAIWEKSSTKSFVCLPLISHGKIIGFSHFDTIEKRLILSNEEILLLGAFNEMIATAIDRKKTDDLLLKHARELEASLNEMITTLGAIVEKHDPYTSGHQCRVAKLSVAIAKDLKLSKEQINNIYIGALIHDIGKIFIPNEILTRPGILSKPEWDIIKSHPQVGYDIIKKTSLNDVVKNLLLSHHERLNGGGYPQGLQGDQIPIEVRVLTVADVVEAMVSHRPYREASGITKALHEINKGELYDEAVVNACVKLFKRKKFKF